jgi:predicted RNase H-like HicB family nuclease
MTDQCATLPKSSEHDDGNSRIPKRCPQEEPEKAPKASDARLGKTQLFCHHPRWIRGIMTLRHDISAAMLSGENCGENELTIVFREFQDDEFTQKYWVAECLEIPGCISQGDSVEEASVNIQDAIQVCLSVIYKDCLARIIACRSNHDLRNISSQRRMTINPPEPQLVYA